MVSARAGARRHGGGAAQDCRRTLSAVPGRQRTGLCQGAGAALGECLGAALRAGAVQVSGQMPAAATREICRAEYGGSRGSKAGAGTHRLLATSHLILASALHLMKRCIAPRGGAQTFLLR